jgi:cyclic beta-1,2-glucan synthetase
LHHTYQTLVREAEEEPIPASHATEWVLDNFYVVQQAIHQIKEDLPPTYYRELPKLEHTSLAGYPRVYGVARHILARVDGSLDIEQTCHFLNAYQEVTPLTMGELWAMPIMLRVATLENLSHTLAHVLDEAPPDGEQASVLVSVLLPPDILVANCILSLRALETYDWQTFFERVSLVEQTLSLDPAQVYDHMTFTTRDRYRKVIEHLARSAGASEVTVAQATIRLAQENETPSRQTHVGYYLIDEGLTQLEVEIGCQLELATRLHRWLFHRHSTFTYLGSITLLTLLALLVPLGYAAVTDASPFQIIIILLLSLIPASTIAINLINWLISYLVSPCVLPKIDFTEGIPAAARTMVVVPSMLTNQEEVDSLLRQLELHYLCNTDSQLTFALLTDFADALEKQMPDDETLLKQAQDGIHALNDQYPDTPFYLFHRNRLWNPQEEAWMGWERKRGKLEEFNHLLLEQGETSYAIQIGDQNILPNIRYIITLDADTVLPRGSAYRLIGTLAHPLNRPCFDPVTGRLTAGYTVLQPRTETKPVSANASLFSRIFDGESGFDLYTHAVSDVYQDLFGEGIYTGKGIYDLKAFAQSLAGRVPENALLSHDLFEGIHGRAALINDIKLYEEYPSSYLAYANRLHRWIRGDWQLLPWLAPRVPHRQHESAPNPLSPIDYWKVVDNMRRSLLAPVLLACLIAGWLWLSGAPLVWTAIIILAPAITLFNHLADRMVRQIRTDKSRGSLWPTIRRQGLHWLLSLTFLPYEALITVDAIAAVFVRLFITKKRLLQWTTTAHTIRLFGKEQKLALFWGRMWIAPALALALATLILWFNPTALPIALPLLLVWLLSPQIAMRISRPISRETAALTSEQQLELHCLARVTWHYFEQFVGPEDHWLPPDHFQEAPRGVIAHRTSPTNIGLMLLSALGAFDLGYLGLLDLTDRLQNSFDSLDSLERHRGHFLNWYDTRTRMPLPTRYISTVDSGNLVGSLIALRQGCLEMPDLFLPRWVRWQGLLDTLGVLDDVICQATSAAPEQIAVIRDHIHRICQQIQDKRQEPETWLQFLTRINENEWPKMAQELATLANIKEPDATFLHRIRRWSERISYHLFDMQRHLGLLVPWPIALHAAPALLCQAETGSPLAFAWERAVDSLPLVCFPDRRIG